MNIKVAFKYIDMERFIKKNIYAGYIRPKLDYAAPVWSPHSRGHSDLLEKVQRRATNTVPEIREYNYGERE